MDNEKKVLESLTVITQLAYYRCLLSRFQVQINRRQETHGVHVQCVFLNYKQPQRGEDPAQDYGSGEGG